jgi:YVTN family beta-propeller protein
MRRLCFLLITVAFLSGCYATATRLMPPLEEEGEVFLYVEPLPGEAERLRFDISEIVAQRDDGRKFPLTLAISEFSVSAINRQRLVASGRVPPGIYTGLAFRAHEAFLQGEERESALLVSAEPLLAPISFEVRKGRAFVLEGTLRTKEAIRDRFSFSPSFSLDHPKRPITALMGYVVNQGSNDITVFDKKAGRVVDVIATGAGPRGIALDQARQRAYVALSGEDSVDIIDVSSNEIIHRIVLNPGDRPQEPALTPDGRILMTANKGSNTVSIIDPVSFIELERIDVGNGPNTVLIDSSGKRAYVFNTLSDSISIIDLVAKPNQVTATISVDAGPLRGQLSRNGDRLYVIHSLSSYLSVIDPSSLAIVQRISVGMGASALKIDTRTDRIYLGRRFDPWVSVYQPGLDMPIDRIMAGDGVSGMAIDGEENDLYLVVPRKSSLQSVDLIGNRTVMELDIGVDAHWVTMMGER